MEPTSFRARFPGQSLPGIATFLLTRTLATLFYTIAYRLRVYHVHRVPDAGACLIASNHQSHLDPPAIACAVQHRAIHFVAKAELFKFKPFGAYISALNSIPVKQDGSADVSAIREILTRLELGVPVLIFPEGSRCFDGRLAPFQRGVSLMMKKARCPVVPCAVEGCFDTWPRTRPFPRFWGRRVGVMFGDPIPPEELLRDGPDAALARLAGAIEDLRVQLRARMRASSAGRFPPPGQGDSRATILSPASPAPSVPA